MVKKNPQILLENTFEEQLGKFKKDWILDDVFESLFF